MRGAFKKVLTFIVSGLALLGSIFLITVLVLSDTKAVRLITEDPRYYEGSFYSEGVLLYETGPLKRGELINYNQKPDKDREADGTIYQFIGWDLDGNGIPDPLGDRIYSNFKARAVFMKLPIPSNFTMTEDQIQMLLNLFTKLNVKLTPEQIKKIIEILQNLNIDWTSIDKSILQQLLDFLGMDVTELMELLGLSFEDLMALINAPVFSYTSTNTALPVFFRMQSYGDYDNGKWKKADYYSTSHISEGSVNPLLYTMDKLSRSVQPIDFTFTYFKTGGAYPVPAYELKNYEGLDSDSISVQHPISSPTEEYPSASRYATTGYGFFPASAYTIPMLTRYQYSNNAIKNDEIAYRQYARDHYLNIDSKYRDYLLNFAYRHDIQYDEYYAFVGKINEVFKDYSLYELNPEEMTSYPKGVDKIEYFLDEAKAGLSENFAAATTLLYRALGVPARYVTGYFDYNPDGAPGEERVVGGLYTHSWVEIYVDNVGWMMVDTSISSQLPPEYAKYLFGSPDVSFDTYDKRTLVGIDVETSKTNYFTGQQFDKKTLTITAKYDNGSTANIPVSLEDEGANSFNSLHIDKPDMYFAGEKTVKVIYVENGIPKTKKITIIVEDPKVIAMSIDAGTYQDTYLPDNPFNGDTMRATLYFNDGHQEKDYRPNLSFEMPDTSTVGEYDIPVKWMLNEEIVSTFHISVVDEPVAPLESLENLQEGSYSHFVRSEFLPSTLRLRAYYEDGTFRNIDETTGSFRIEGDLSTVGTHEITVYYTERGVTKFIVVTVVVRNLTEDAYFKIHNVKEYDGKNFDIASSIEIWDGDENVMNEGDQVEIKIVKTPTGFDPENFINANQKYKISFRIRILNSYGVNILDEYIGQLENINIKTDDAAMVTYPKSKFVVDEDGYMTFPSINFNITLREINITSINAKVDPKDPPEESIYYREDNGMQISPSDMFTYTHYEDETIPALCEGHSVDLNSLVFSTLGEDTYVDNALDLDAFKILDAEGNDVTSNYNIHHSWGKLSKY